MYVFWSWNTVQKSILFFYLSICTHYSCFENMGQFVTLKKIRSKIWVAKSRVQKTGSLLFKKRKICRWNQPFTTWWLIEYLARRQVYENEDSPSEIILLDCVLQLRSTVCALRRTPNARKLRQYIITNVLMYAIQADHWLLLRFVFNIVYQTNSVMPDPC